MCGACLLCVCRTKVEMRLFLSRACSRHTGSSSGRTSNAGPSSSSLIASGFLGAAGFFFFDEAALLLLLLEAEAARAAASAEGESARVNKQQCGADGGESATCPVPLHASRAQQLLARPWSLSLIACAEGLLPAVVVAVCRCLTCFVSELHGSSLCAVCLAEQSCELGQERVLGHANHGESGRAGGRVSDEERDGRRREGRRRRMDARRRVESSLHRTQHQQQQQPHTSATNSATRCTTTHPSPAHGSRSAALTGSEARCVTRLRRATRTLLH